MRGKAAGKALEEKGPAGGLLFRVRRSRCVRHPRSAAPARSASPLRRSRCVRHPRSTDPARSAFPLRRSRCVRHSPPLLRPLSSGGKGLREELRSESCCRKGGNFSPKETGDAPSALPAHGLTPAGTTAAWSARVRHVRRDAPRPVGNGAPEKGSQGSLLVSGKWRRRAGSHRSVPCFPSPVACCSALAASAVAISERQNGVS